ncbi:hypothetical protein C1645_774149 [Glomus cerebriforme]|uniref:Uncharacterized protein n=1 Tax=Glomus cerebriforme TaxID=658196 RepID=A0A397SRJ7_9GLOM|nr:hypothetical protein C1645_774149 [Glomus cerebriforme]
MDEKNNLNDNVIQEEIINDDVINLKESRDPEASNTSINLDQIHSKQKDNSENVIKKVNVHSRFISVSKNTNTMNDDLLVDDSRDDEFDLIINDKTKTTLIEKCATIPRRSSETEVLVKKGRFTIIREADNKFSTSRTGESNNNKSFPSSYSSYSSTTSQSCCSSCSSLPVSLFESSDSLTFKGTTKIRKNNDQFTLAHIYSNSPLSSFSPYYSNSQMCSSPLSLSFASHSNYHFNNKNLRRASDSVAHHYNFSSQHDNTSYNNKQPTLPSQNSPIILQHNLSYSPTSSPQISPDTTPTSTLISPISKSTSSTSTVIKPITQQNQSNRDSTSFPDIPHTPHSTTSTISTTTSIVSTPSGRIFELEGSYFPNNSVSPSSTGSNGSKRRRKFIIETCE